MHHSRPFATIILMFCLSITTASSPGQYFCSVVESSDCIEMSETNTDPVLDLIAPKLVFKNLVTNNKSNHKTISKKHELEVYSNSSSSVSFLLNINKASRSVIIENSEGKIVYSSVINASSPTLNTEELNQGNYTLKTFDVFSDLTGEVAFVKM